MTLGAGRPSSLLDLPSVLLTIEATTAIDVVATLASPPSPTTGVNMPTTSASYVVTSTSTIATPLPSASVATTSAPMMPHPASLAPPIPPFAVLLVAP